MPTRPKTSLSNKANRPTLSISFPFLSWEKESFPFILRCTHSRSSFSLGQGEKGAIGTEGRDYAALYKEHEKKYVCSMLKG